MRRVQLLLEKQSAVCPQSGAGGYLVKSFSRGCYFPVNFTGPFPICQNDYCQGASSKVICCHIVAVFISNSFSLAGVYSHLEEKLLSGKKSSELVCNRESQRRKDTLQQFRQLNHPKLINSQSLGRKPSNKARRSYNRKKGSIETYSSSQDQEIIDGDKSENESNTEFTSENELDGEEEFSNSDEIHFNGEDVNDSMGEMDWESGSEAEQQEPPNKRLRTYTNVSSRAFYQNLDTNDRRRKSKSYVENSIYFIPKGGKSGKLPSCKVCKKNIERDECRVAWFFTFKNFVPSLGKSITGKITAYYLCPTVDCIMGSFNLGSKKITYNGETLQCNEELNPEEMQQYKELQDALGIV